MSTLDLLIAMMIPVSCTDGDPVTEFEYSFGICRDGGHEQLISHGELFKPAFTTRQ
jgi:hypothetical protein